MIIYILILTIICFMLFFSKEEELFTRKKRYINNKFIDEISKKIKIANIEIAGLQMNLQIILGFTVTFSLILFYFLSPIIEINSILLFSSILLIFFIYFITLIDKYYNKQKEDLESQILNIGLVIKQLVSMKKPTDSIIKALSKSSNKVVSKEFEKVYFEYKKSNSIIFSLDVIKKRYPNSIINSIMLLLKIYTEHKKDITEEIANLMREVESINKIKKKIEVEFIKYDKNINSLLGISFLFTISFIYMNTSYREFYSSKSGIFIGFLIFIYELIGFGLIWFFKSSIIKIKRQKRINVKRGQFNENIIR